MPNDMAQYRQCPNTIYKKKGKFWFIIQVHSRLPEINENLLLVYLEKSSEFKNKIKEGKQD
jgi:hypothetical protein